MHRRMRYIHKIGEEIEVCVIAAIHCRISIPLHVPACGIRRAHLLDEPAIFQVDVYTQYVLPRKLRCVDVVDLNWNQKYVVVSLDMRVT